MQRHYELNPATVSVRLSQQQFPAVVLAARFIRKIWRLAILRTGAPGRRDEYLCSPAEHISHLCPT